MEICAAAATSCLKLKRRWIQKQPALKGTAAKGTTARKRGFRVAGSTGSDREEARGEEVTDEIIDGEKSVIWQQASNRVHAQKSIINWCLN